MPPVINSLLGSFDSSPWIKTYLGQSRGVAGGSEAESHCVPVKVLMGPGYTCGGGRLDAGWIEGRETIGTQKKTLLAIVQGSEQVNGISMCSNGRTKGKEEKGTSK